MRPRNITEASIIRVIMDGALKASFDTAQLREIKRQVAGDRSYSDRISLSFAFQLSLAGG